MNLCKLFTTVLLWQRLVDAWACTTLQTILKLPVKDKLQNEESSDCHNGCSNTDSQMLIRRMQQRGHENKYRVLRKVDGTCTCVAEEYSWTRMFVYMIFGFFWGGVSIIVMIPDLRNLLSKLLNKRKE